MRCALVEVRVPSPLRAGRSQLERTRFVNWCTVQLRTRCQLVMQRSCAFLNVGDSQLHSLFRICNNVRNRFVLPTILASPVWSYTLFWNSAGEIRVLVASALVTALFGSNWSSGRVVSVCSVF